MNPSFSKLSIQIALAVFVAVGTASSSNGAAAANMTEPGCMKCSQSCDGGSCTHRFNGQECDSHETWCYQCSDIEPGNECHTEFSGGSCSDHHRFCGMTGPGFAAVSRLKGDDVEAVKRFVTEHPNLVRIDTLRRSLQLVDCTGKGRARLRLSDEAFAAVKSRS